MLIAARNGFLVGGKLSAKSYIQDGLIAMWDGIENAGWGVHDPNATTWKDLVGSDDLLFRSTPTWSGDYLLINENATQCAYGSHMYDFKGGAFHIDIVAEPTIGYGDMFSLDTNAGSGLVGFNLNYSGVATWWGTGANSDIPILYEGKRTFACVDRTSRDFDYTRKTLDGSLVSNGSQPAGTVRGFVSLGALRNQTGRYIPTTYWCAFRIYSRALTSDEIAHNYAVDKARFNLP